MLSPGEYDCDVVKTAGVWRFRRRDLAMDQVVQLRDAIAGQR